MATTWVTVLALPLLLLATTHVYSQEGLQLDLNDTGIIAAMRGVGQALECFSDSAQEGLRLQKESVAAMSNLLPLQSLPDTVVALTQEMEVLKNQLETSDKKEETLAEILKETIHQLQNKDLKMQDLDRKLTEFQLLIQQLENTVQQLNNTASVLTVYKVENQKECAQPRLLEIKKLVEQFNTDDDWNRLRRGLESVVDHGSEEYSQLKKVGYLEKYWHYVIGSYTYTQLASLLLCAELNVDKHDSDGDTLLHGAAISGDLQLVKLLLDYGADVNKKGHHGTTPLVRYLENNGSMKVVKALVQGGTNTALSDDYGNTALGKATQMRRTDIIRYLEQFPY